MAGNSFGQRFKVTTFGESHGPALGVVIDGCPAGQTLPLEAISAQMRRRKPGQSKLTTARKEDDVIEVLSGVDPHTNKTLGSSLALLIRNKDARSLHYNDLSELYRPSHADFTYHARYGIPNQSGGGRASARETAARVAAGAIADAAATYSSWATGPSYYTTTAAAGGAHYHGCQHLVLGTQEETSSEDATLAARLKKKRQKQHAEVAG